MSVKKELTGFNGQLKQIVDNSEKSFVESSAFAEMCKRLNDFSKKPNNFAKFAAEKKLVQNIMTVLDRIVANTSSGSSVTSCTHLLIGCLANLAIDSKARAEILDNGKVVEILEKVLKRSSVMTQVLTRVARLIANLCRGEESVAEDMFSSNIVFSLLKHAAFSTHVNSPECSQCMARCVRMLCAGRPHLLSMMIIQGGVSAVSRSFSSSLPEAAQLEILKTLKELCTTNCTMELAGQVKESGILSALVETGLRQPVTEANHLTLRVLSELVQFSLTRAILGCCGCHRLFFSVIKNTCGSYSKMEISRCISGICFLCRECLTRLKMREQGFIPDLVALLSDRTYERHFSNILTSIFCFSYDEPGLMLMVQHNLINHVCRILDEFSFDKASHVKCSEKCQVKERDLQQMRPDLFSLDYGLPWELNRSVSVTSALSSCFSPKAAGDISPPWCFNPAASPARMMSPPRGTRQWLPFSQSPHLEVSPNHYLSPSYQSSFSLDMSSNPTEGFNFSDDEDSDHKSVEESRSEKDVPKSQLQVSSSEQSIATETNTIENPIEDAPPSFVNLDFVSPTIESKEMRASESGAADFESASRDSGVNKCDESSCPSEAKKQKVDPSVNSGKSCSETTGAAASNSCNITCIESNIIHLLSRLSLIRDTSLALCSSETVTSLLDYYSKLPQGNSQIQRIFQRLIESVVTFMELIRNKFPVILYRAHKKYTAKSGSMNDLMDCLWKAIQFNSESSYNYNELFTGLSKNPIEFQFSIAVCVPHVLTKAPSQKQFLVDHFTLDLLVNSFSKTEFLTDVELRDSVLALRSVLKLADTKSVDDNDLETRTVSDDQSDDKNSDVVTLRFSDNKKLKFDKHLLTSTSDVLRIMLDKDSGFSEGGLDEIVLRGGISSEIFQAAYHLVCCCRLQQMPSLQLCDNRKVDAGMSANIEPFEVLSVMDMYNFISSDVDPEKLAQLFIQNYLPGDSSFGDLVIKTALLTHISMSSLNLLSIIVFQHLFAKDSPVSEDDCVLFMKQLVAIPQFTSLLLECFQEKVVKFYFSN